MTTLDAYARFLTARWDEIEDEPQAVHNLYSCERSYNGYAECDCGFPSAVLADLAAKREIVAGVLDSDDPATWVLILLAEPFRDHPDHPANQEA